MPVLLSVIGAQTYSLLRNLISPSLLKDKSFDEIVEVLKKHYEPKPNVIMERFYFHRRNQATDESIVEFGDYLKDALRDRLVCGLKDQNIQRMIKH